MSMQELSFRDFYVDVRAEPARGGKPLHSLTERQGNSHMSGWSCVPLDDR